MTTKLDLMTTTYDKDDSTICLAVVSLECHNQNTSCLLLEGNNCEIVVAISLQDHNPWSVFAHRNPLHTSASHHRVAMHIAIAV